MRRLLIFLVYLLCVRARAIGINILKSYFYSEHQPSELLPEVEGDLRLKIQNRSPSLNRTHARWYVEQGAISKYRQNLQRLRP